MGKITYLIIGLITGIGIGVVAMQLWYDRSSEPQEVTKQEAQTASEIFLLCKSDFLKDELPLIIKNDVEGAKTLTIPWSSKADVFTVEETTDLQYTAKTKPDPEVPEAYSSLVFNRIEGELVIQTRLPSGVLKLLQDVCDKKIDYPECYRRLENVKGASRAFACAGASDQSCPRLRSSGLPNPSSLRCKKAENRF